MTVQLDMLYECRLNMHGPDLKPTHSTTIVTVHIKFVLPVSNLTLMIRSSTNQKLPCMLQLQSSPLQVMAAALRQ